MGISITSSVAMLAYLAAGFLVFIQMLKHRTVVGRARMALFGLCTTGLLLHTLVLLHHFTAANGLNFAIFNALSLLAWLIVLLWGIAIVSRPVESLGVAILPLASLALLLELLFPSQHVVSSDQFSLKLHILISIIAYSIFTIAACQAVLLAIHDRHLHNKQPGGFIRVLPPLQTMEALLFQMIGVGFILHSLSLISGFAFLEDMFAQHMVHKTILSLAAWLIFAVLLWGRWRFGWRGKTAIRATLSGFVALLLAYLGSKVVLEILLGYQ